MRLSGGMHGEPFGSYTIEIDVKRRKEYGLEPVLMPNPLKGLEYWKSNPAVKAKNLKDVFYMILLQGLFVQ